VGKSFWLLRKTSFPEKHHSTRPWGEGREMLGWKEGKGLNRCRSRKGGRNLDFRGGEGQIYQKRSCMWFRGPWWGEKRRGHIPLRKGKSRQKKKGHRPTIQKSSGERGDITVGTGIGGVKKLSLRQNGKPCKKKLPELLQTRRGESAVGAFGSD